MLQSATFRFILILILVTFSAYFSSFGNPFIWDDEQFITSNVYVKTFDIPKIFTSSVTSGGGIVSNYYRPITSFSFALDTKIWGQNPFGFHLTNTILHISSGILLFLLLSSLGFPQLASFFVSMLFLLHPIDVEAVAYINSRGDPLAAAFLLGSFLLFVRSFQKKKPLVFLAVSVFLYIGALLSKETAITGVLIYPGLIFLYMQQQKITHSSFFKTFKAGALAFLAMIVCDMFYVILRLTFLNFSNTLNFYGSQNVYTSNLALRLSTFAKIVWIYLGIIVWPLGLHAERNTSLVASLVSPWVISTILLFGVLVFSSVILFWKKKNLFFAFGLLFSIVFLIPVSGVIPINGLLYEHWLYLPIIGCFIMVFSLGYSVLPTKHKSFYKNILIAFVIVVLIFYWFITLYQIQIWSDPVRFYTYTLQFAPDSARLHNNLGMSLSNRGDYEGSVKEYEKALALSPGYPQIYNNLGNSQISLGDYADAEKNLQKALTLAPSFTIAKYNLVKLYFVTHQVAKAKSFFANDPVGEQAIRFFEQTYSH